QQIDELYGYVEAEHQSLKRQPFADESVEGRQTGDRQRANKEISSGMRHPLQQAAHFFYVSSMSLLNDRTRAKKEQRFEDGVVQTMVESRHKRQRGKGSETVD